MSTSGHSPNPLSRRVNYKYTNVILHSATRYLDPIFLFVDTYPSLNDLPLIGQLQHHFPFAQSLQKTNEVTPQQHSIKRKISSIVDWASNGEMDIRKQLKRQHSALTKAAQQYNSSGFSLGMGMAEPPNSSDEENTGLAVSGFHGLFSNDCVSHGMFMRSTGYCSGIGCNSGIY